MPEWQGSDQGVCWNRPSALNSLGGPGGYGRSEGGGRAQLVGHSLTKVSLPNGNLTLSVFRTPRVRKKPDKNDENCPDCSSL
jgi:hypothetical protein